jgi:uncharacterized phiE125 gp8 family phage protein
MTHMLTDLAPPPVVAAQIAALAAQLRLPAGYAEEPDGAARLAVLFQASVAHIEARIARALVRRAFRLDVRAWPADGRVILPVAPVARLVSLDVVDAEGGRTGWDIGQAWLDALGSAPNARAVPLHEWPFIPDGGHAEMVFEAGYGAEWADVPPDLRLAVLMLATTLHDAGLDRDTAALPFGVVALTEPYRRVRI